MKILLLFITTGIEFYFCKQEKKCIIVVGLEDSNHSSSSFLSFSSRRRKIYGFCLVCASANINLLPILCFSLDGGCSRFTGYFCVEKRERECRVSARDLTRTNSYEKGRYFSTLISTTSYSPTTTERRVCNLSRCQLC